MAAIPIGCKLNQIEFDAIYNMTAIQFDCRGWDEERVLGVEFGYNVAKDYYFASVSIRFQQDDFELIWPGGDFRALMAFYAGRL